MWGGSVPVHGMPSQALTRQLSQRESQEPALYALPHPFGGGGIERSEDDGEVLT